MKKNLISPTIKKKSSSIRTKRKPVDPATMTLVEGHGSSDRGGGPGGHYWHIQVEGKRVGYVFINIICDKFFGKHPSIQIHINQPERDKQIGRIAYRLACEQSGNAEVYAHMRKNNKASRRAAEEAGFRIVGDKNIHQLAMVWQLDSKVN